MWEPELCSICKIGHFMPAGNRQNAVVCDNPDCRQRKTYLTAIEEVKISEEIPENRDENPEMKHFRDEEGD